MSDFQTHIEKRSDGSFLFSVAPLQVSKVDFNSQYLVSKLQEILNQTNHQKLLVLIDLRYVYEPDAYHGVNEEGGYESSNLLYFKAFMENEIVKAGIIEFLDVTYMNVSQKILEKGAIPLSRIVDLREKNYDFSFLEQWAAYGNQGQSICPFECSIPYLIGGVDLSDFGYDLEELFSHHMLRSDVALVFDAMEQQGELPGDI